MRLVSERNELLLGFPPKLKPVHAVQRAAPSGSTEATANFNTFVNYGCWLHIRSIEIKVKRGFIQVGSTIHA